MRAKCPAYLILLDFVIPISKTIFIYHVNDERRELFKNTEWQEMPGHTCGEIKPLAKHFCITCQKL
jgi:hypothetical protein